MSRATVDLQSIRFFLGYGLVFLTQNALTLAARERGDVRAQARPRGPGAAAGAVRGPVGDAVQPALATGGPGGPAAARRAHRGGRGGHLRDPDREGVRPRAASCSSASAARSARVFDQEIYSTRLQAFYSPMLGFLPSLGLGGGAAGRRPAGDPQHPVAGRVHRLLHLPDHAHVPDAHARHGAGDGAAGGRLGQPAVRDPRSRAADREPSGRAAASGGPGAGRAARRLARLQRRRAGAGGHRARGRGRADRGPRRARPGRARRAWWR